MSLDTRADAAAERLRLATPADTEAGLARVRPTVRRRNLARLVAAAVVVAGVTGAVSLGSSDRAVPPVDTPSRQSGIVVSAVANGRTPVSEVGTLPEAGTAPYPVWSAFDQDAGLFLFTAEGVTGESARDLATLLVRSPGEDDPVASIRCEEQCNWHPTFGPGPDEVTVMAYPGTARVYGFDGEVRAEIDIGAVLTGAGVADLEWSPDGTRLAVSTFTGGSREPSCEEAPREAHVWLFDRSGGTPESVYSERAAAPETRHPVLSDLAWAADSRRLGLISSSYCTLTGDSGPNSLVSVDVGSARARIVHRFGLCCETNAWVTDLHGFAWSPDGARVVVTSGGPIAELDLDGRVLVRSRGTGPGPLAWLPDPDG